MKYYISPLLKNRLTVNSLINILQTAVNQGKLIGDEWIFIDDKPVSTILPSGEMPPIPNTGILFLLSENQTKFKISTDDTLFHKKVGTKQYSKMLGYG